MSTRAQVLVIDDEEGICLSLCGILEDEGYSAFAVGTGEAGLALLEKEHVDLVFLDIWMPGMDGMEVLDELHSRYPALPVLMISGHGSIETAVTAIKKGAHDFIEKPLSLEKVIIAAERALEFYALKRVNTELRERLEEKLESGPMGTSPVMLELREQIQKVAPLDTWVLITGENGTGKELVAKAVHNASRRSDGPLIAVNCAAIPEELIESELFGHEKGAFTGADAARMGKFEMANNGTLFLDEIGDMSLKTQAKILRVLQEQAFERVGGGKTFKANVRVIAATNKDLESAIASGEFREDLYYRLRVFPLYVPPLRERGNDILLLIDYFNATLAQALSLLPVEFASDAKKALMQYFWPGNVRELRNFMERIIILRGGSTVELAMLPPEFNHNVGNGKNISSALSDVEMQHSPTPENHQPQEMLKDDFKSARSAFEAHFLEAKLREFGGNISRLAEAVGLERSYLSRKLKAYNIQGSYTDLK